MSDIAHQTYILITGGLGYIGSHLALSLESSGRKVVLIDNLHNSSIETLKKFELILGYTPIFHEGDICDKSFLEDIFSKYQIHTVIHLAALKSIKESFRYPDRYYHVNIDGTKVLLGVMHEYGVNKILFASSCSAGISNHAYGKSKQEIEETLYSLAQSGKMEACVLRLYNVIGNHPSGYFGESTDSHYLSIIQSIYASVQHNNPLMIDGDQYQTMDGTPARDYVDIEDVTELIQDILTIGSHGYQVLDVGSGKSYTVKQIIGLFEKVSGIQIGIEIGPNREDNIHNFVADTSIASSLYNWKPKVSLEESLRRSWRYIQHGKMR